MTQDWRAKANAVVSCGPGDHTSNVAQNLLITKAYARLYIDHRDVCKWAGMAAYASDMVGLGIAGGKSIDIYVDQNARSGPIGPYGETMGAPVMEFPPERINTTDLDNMLILGNKAVFRDVYWQHLAYLEGGLDTVVAAIGKAGLKQGRILIEGWEAIDRGRRNNSAGDVWYGNTKLLLYEQMITLQPVYDRYPRLSELLSYVMISPLHLHVGAFKEHRPDGNIGSFADRWSWIENVLIPKWKELDAGSMLSHLRLIYMGNFPQGAACVL